jgi:hypothetical protein
MLTAKEFFDRMLEENKECTSIEMMIEFAKYHVEQDKKEIAKNIKMKIKTNIQELDMMDDWMEVDKNSILSAYPLDNIV